MSRITFIEMVENIKHAMIPGNDIKIEDIIKKRYYRSRNKYLRRCNY